MFFFFLIHFNFHYIIVDKSVLLVSIWRLIEFSFKNGTRTLSKPRTTKCLICILDFFCRISFSTRNKHFFYIPTISFPLINNFRSTVQVSFFFFWVIFVGKRISKSGKRLKQRYDRCATKAELWLDVEDTCVRRHVSEDGSRWSDEPFPVYCRMVC